MKPTPTSPGASRKSAVTPEYLALLNAGLAEARTLTEALVIDHRVLLATAVPEASRELGKAVARAQELGILKRMTAIGEALHRHLAPTEVTALAAHPSDTVRGWVCFAALAAERLAPSGDAARLLEICRPLAEDSRFTVREWVWMSARPVLVEDLAGSIELLLPWAQEESENLRRFASESLRPRGVWASHIAEFKADPALGERLLEPLRSDPSRYVQDSVGNWINDAAKSSPDWARALCWRWNQESPTPQTAYITKRGLRSLK